MQSATIDLVMDVKVKVTVQLGSSMLSMREVLALVAGSVIQLQHKASEPVGLYVNDNLVAYGEVVVVDERLGVTMTEIVKVDRS